MIHTILCLFCFFAYAIYDSPSRLIPSRLPRLLFAGPRFENHMDSLFSSSGSVSFM